MSVTIFRKIGGRVVPMVVDEARAVEFQASGYTQMPRHQVNRKKFDTISSFTVPNAVCQKCGKGVFYYENSYGSRVLFDALGPPWPVHPCYSSGFCLDDRKNTEPLLEWYPVIIEKCVQTSSGGVRMQGYLHDVKIRFSFDESVLTKMKVTLMECYDLIVFASQDKKKVQTSTGKRIFQSYYETITEIDYSIEANSLSRHHHAVVKIINDKDIDIDVFENGKPVIRYTIEYASYSKYFIDEQLISAKSYYTETGERVDSARSSSYGMYILLGKIARKITDLSAVSESRYISQSTPMKSKFSIKKINIIKESDIIASIILNGVLNNIIDMHYVVSDSLIINRLLSICNDHPTLIFKNNHSLEENDSKVEIRIFGFGMCTDLTMPVEYVSKHKALSIITNSLEHTASVSTKRDHSRKSIKKKKNVTSRDDVHLKDSKIRVKKKRTISVEEKINRAALGVDSPMADAFRNAKNTTSKK